MLSRVAALAACAAALGAGVASASVSIPTTALPLSATGEDVNDPQVAVDPSGNAFYAWVRDQPGAGTLKFIQAVRVSSAGAVGTVHTVSIATENACCPAVAASPDGTGIVVWQEFQSGSSDRQVRSARINANGTLGTIQTMSDLSNDVSDPDVGIDGTNKAIVVWVNRDGNDTIEARTRAANDAVGSLEDAASQAAIDAVEPDIAVAPGGDAILVFQRDLVSDHIHFKRRLANSTWQQANLGTSLEGEGHATSPQVAIDQTGEADAVATWREAASGSLNSYIRARRIESTDTDSLAGIQPIPVSDTSQDADQPKVDMDGAGNAYLTWRRSNGTVNVPQYTYMSPGGGAGTTHNLNPSGALNADQPQVAVDTAGNATFVWRFGLNIQTRSLPGGPGGTLTPIQDLTTTGSNTEPRVDANAAGARWGAYRLDGAGSNDQAFGFFDLTAPTGPDTNPPDTVITSGPANGSTTTQTTATFGFTNIPDETVTFQCSFDGSAFGPCSGPGATHSIGSLSLGAHTFQVRATDLNLNPDPSPAQSTFTVLAPPAAPAVGQQAALAKKKCKKGRKLKKGKCVKKKKKK
jgi:hypothetical protein